MEVKTVKVVSPVSDDNTLGYIVINESDLTDAHELFDENATVTQNEMTVTQLKDALTAANIAFPANAKKAYLLALLPKA